MFVAFQLHQSKGSSTALFTVSPPLSSDDRIHQRDSSNRRPMWTLCFIKFQPCLTGHSSAYHFAQTILCCGMLLTMISCRYMPPHTRPVDALFPMHYDENLNERADRTRLVWLVSSKSRAVHLVRRVRAGINVETSSPDSAPVARCLCYQTQLSSLRLTHIDNR